MAIFHLENEKVLFFELLRNSQPISTREHAMEKGRRDLHEKHVFYCSFYKFPTIMVRLWPGGANRTKISDFLASDCSILLNEARHITPHCHGHATLGPEAP